MQAYWLTRGGTDAASVRRGLAVRVPIHLLRLNQTQRGKNGFILSLQKSYLFFIYLNIDGKGRKPLICR